MTRSRSSRDAGPSGSLSDEEHALWRHAARTVEPLASAKTRIGVPGRQAQTGEGEGPGRLHMLSTWARRKHHDSAGGDQTPARQVALRPSAPALPHHKPPALGGIDHKTAKRIRSGRTEIDGRIDLHGMRQSEAHAALRGYLQKSWARGARVVLVITGKGGAGRGGSPFSERDWLDGPDRGVLRRNVPLWLAEPELRAIVIGTAPAAPTHGGEGALYVTLRRRAFGD